MTITSSPATSTPSTAERPASGIPFGNLLRVETRKLVDTRPSRWLLVGVALSSLLAAAALLVVGLEDMPRTVAFFTQVAALPILSLLPVFAALTMTSEWTQRTALVTFALEPRRGRVVAAKLLAIAGTVPIAIALVVAVAATCAAVATLFGAPLQWDLTAWQLLGLTGQLLVMTLFGAVLGLLLMNTTAAIVTLFALPPVLAIASVLSPALGTVLAWVDLKARAAMLVQLPAGSGQEWAQFGVACLTMLVIPAVVGTARTLQREPN